MDYARLGALLREGRRSSSLTQGDVANVLGVSFQNVSHWELGKIKIDIDSFIRLCEIYGLDVAETLHTASERSEKDATVPGEKSLLSSYRQLDRAGRRLVDTVVEDQLLRIQEDQGYQAYLGKPIAARGGGVMPADEEMARQLYRAARELEKSNPKD